MSDILDVLKKQLEIEINSAKQKLNSNNLDSIYKITSSIVNIEKINIPEEKTARNYGNGVFEKNIDSLYQKYADKKTLYRDNPGPETKELLIESTRKLMSEVYDMIESMLKDCECADEKREIQVFIEKTKRI